MTTPADELAAFLRRALPQHRSRWGDDTGFEAKLAWQRLLNTERWVAPSWPVEHGGRGLDVATSLECAEVLAASGAPGIAGVFGVLNVGPTLVQWGNAAQQAHLPKILDGTEIWCQGFSEPDAGSDLAALQTRAELHGDEFVIDGQKIWTSHGMRADHIQLLVRTDRTVGKHQGISVLLVPLTAEGVERRPIRQINGEAEFAEIYFSGVRVPRDALLGPLNQGWNVTMTTLGHERAGLVNYASQLEREVEEVIRAWRPGPGRQPLDAVRADELVKRYVESRVLGALGRRSLESIRTTGRPGPEQSIIKIEWSLLSQRLADTAITLAGLDGVAGTGNPRAHRYLTERAATIAGGTTEILTTVVAQRVLGLPR
ncbi:acyl-CoA dehydrogenase family protein [Streptomyces sp. NPDC007264]|uniref:acyl-CoA dehydrogenase family protein n=1 Tax=Streptomyces sp. NPDC007264 TaxID=3364777 RepID=UPI0036D7D5B6